MEPTGLPARELDDAELERQGTYAHATRNWVFLHGTAEQFAHHTERMLDLEQEYLRRHPKRTWQGSTTDGTGTVDEVTRLRTALRGIVTQLEAILEQTTPTPSGDGTASGAGGVAELLRAVAATPSGRMHRLELHQTARRCGVPPAELAGLYRQDPALLAADGADRVLTPAGRDWLAGRSAQE